MGLFSGMKILSGGGAGGFLSGLSADRLLRGSNPGGPNLGEDPRLTAIRRRMFQEADTFRKNLPGAKDRAMGTLRQEANSALKSGITNTRRNFNQRGLLYSGMRQGGEQTVRGRVASSLASGIADSNRELENEASARDFAASSVGLQGYGDSINRANQLYDLRNQNAMARRQALQSIGQGVGYATGSYFGRDPASESIRRKMMGGNTYMTNEF